MQIIGDLKVGERAKVVGYSGERGSYRQKLLSLGIVRNAEFEVVRLAPFGNPV